MLFRSNEILARTKPQTGGYSGGGGTVSQPKEQKNVELVKTGSVVETAKKTMKAGYTPSEVYSALKKNGISSGRAHTAVKQAQILEDYFKKMK